ncbi:MAG: DNA gyrase inhibitor YacG [Erythrobacter sp.]
MTIKPKPCPICRKPLNHALTQQSGSAQANPFHPFCSQRCKDRDLARWFSDSYAVPGPPADPEELARESWREQD